MPAIPTPDTTPERKAQFIKDELATRAPIIQDAYVVIASGAFVVHHVAE